MKQTKKTKTKIIKEDTLHNFQIFFCMSFRLRDKYILSTSLLKEWNVRNIMPDK